MVVAAPTVSDVYTNTEVLKTKIDEVSQKLTSEETNLKNLQEQVKRLESPPMIG
jgi:cell division protein FtsL